jgi:hypothetical protein
VLHHRGTGWTVSLILTLWASPAAALPLLSEVFYDAVGSDDGRSFVELWGAPGTSLDGLRLEGINGANGGVGPVVTLGGVFPADGIFVVADDAGDGSTEVAGADLIANFDFQNGPDSIVLRDDDVVFDAVGYGVFGVGEVFAGEGSPAPDAPADSSLARLFADVDSDDNAADFVVLSVPTPGSAPLLGLPEPGTALLLALGLAGLVRAQRTPRSGSGRSPRIRKRAGAERRPARSEA